MSSPATTLYCFRCQHHPGPDDEPLKRCGRCRARHYCTADCQRNDWPRHKQECRILAAGGTAPARQRTTMRLTGFPSRETLESQGGPEVDPDVIYYVKTSKPHIQDISISGPFYPYETVLHQLLGRLRMEKSKEGECALDDIVYGGGVVHLESFNAPLPDGNIMKFQLLREKNAAVARSLPGEAWNIIVASPSMNRAGRTAGLGRVEDMDVEATFRTKAEADRKAEQVLEELRVEAGEGAHVERVPGGLMSAVVIPRPGSGRKIKLLEVRRDDGCAT